MTQPELPSASPTPATETVEQALRRVTAADDTQPRPNDAVTDCNVRPGHNRLEDREGA